ncbi:hypothetical protein AGDE_10766 [Angomonas deanei]|uniref:Uncharacterized protein n=1 Tax=Angomonas deanei TaxID=59799 RepID=S9U9E1_9TRYP|nr:hypothetical protein AGDE_11813 [Angomonas deanei]EPY27437.1 hypothetical protein AGDE_10766 [Angomonas deanei]CAD2217703.1 hypothetical protein, conserved [Angomonas deanei]|eukprot:EPY25394.1 hypothetical protein AGDE_11813 [Angomonas deanei]
MLRWLPCTARITASGVFPRGLCSTVVCRQKQKQTTSGYMANAGKVGGEEKWAQAAMEYIYEKNHVNDGRKRQRDVRQERQLAEAYDRYTAVNEATFSERIARLTARQSEVLSVLQAMCPPSESGTTLLEECLLLQTEQLPHNIRRPSLSPPVPGYEPGFGLDVPQLRSQQQEYPAVRRPTDKVQYQTDHAHADNADPTAPIKSFPYLDMYDVENLTSEMAAELEEIHGTLRSTAPVSGVEGEGWEVYMALQKKSLARQALILELYYDNDGFTQKYNEDAEFRQAELARRGLLPLEVDNEREEGTHFAQVPAYEPFREL